MKLNCYGNRGGTVLGVAKEEEKMGKAGGGGQSIDSNITYQQAEKNTSEPGEPCGLKKAAKVHPS